MLEFCHWDYLESSTFFFSSEKLKDIQTNSTMVFFFWPFQPSFQFIMPTFWEFNSSLGSHTVFYRMRVHFWCFFLFLPPPWNGTRSFTWLNILMHSNFLHFNHMLLMFRKQNPGLPIINYFVIIILSHLFYKEISWH